MIENFDRLIVNAGLCDIIREVADDSASETMMDFALNRWFRRDLYTRDAPKISRVESAEIMMRTRFALVRPREECDLQAEATAGGIRLKITLEHSAFRPVLDLLAAGPATCAELSIRPEVAHLDNDRLRQVLHVLSAVGYVRLALPRGEESHRRISAGRFNEALLTSSAAGHPPAALASPVLGSGIRVNHVEQLFLAAHLKGDDPVDYAGKAQRRFSGTSAVNEDSGQLRERASRFVNVSLPLLRQLGVV